MSLKNQTILLVEDEFLVCMDLAETLERYGAIVFTAKTLTDAIALVDRGISGAIVEHVLADGDSEQLCARLHERGIPFVNFTGYDMLNGACQHGPVVTKPASAERVISVLQQLL